MKVSKICFLIFSLTLFSCGAHIKLPPVHLAAIKGNMESLKASANKENINSLSDIGWTPLMHASSEGHIEAVKFLIKSGADVNYVSGGRKIYSNRTALVLAAAEGNNDIIELLIENGAKVNLEGAKSPIIYAAEEASLETIKLLENHGLDIHFKNEYGVTTLIQASGGGNLEVAKYLIEQKVDLEAESEYGEFALGEACLNDEPEIVKLLIDSGAEVDKFNEAGINSLTYATIDGNTELVNLLINAGADPHKRINERPMFLYAFAEENFETADLLLKHGGPCRR